MPSRAVRLTGMQRELFLTIIGAIGVCVGGVALLHPATLLAGKGVPPGGAAAVWMRETGALILSASVVVLLLRGAPDSATLRAVLWGNALLHATMFPIELAAWRRGTITRASGVVPSSILHVAACVGFTFHALRTTPP